MSQSLSPEMLAARAQQVMLSKKTKKTTAAATPSRHLSPTQQRGHQYEKQAIRYLQKQGLHILLHNLDARFGEIDIVARSQNCLVFIEVRQRQSNLYGGALASVQAAKQRRIKRAARYFLPSLSQQFFDGQTPFCRFDVIAIEGQTWHWIRDAFR